MEQTKIIRYKSFSIRSEIIEDEGFFFEFKNDQESNSDFIKEVSSFANTYGGYIFLGVDDDKTISGCQSWNEQKIHNVMNNCITPLPVFDVRRFKISEANIYIVKVEEGVMPPYITNSGKIYERVSSGSIPVKDSSKLNQLYKKHEDQKHEISRKIELDPIKWNIAIPNNICGHIDFGFSLTCSEETRFEKEFGRFDFSSVCDFLKNSHQPYNISYLGNSYVISIGRSESKNEQGQPILVPTGINNLIEIYYDGSVRCRVVIVSKSMNDGSVNLFNIDYLLMLFRDIYKQFLNEPLHKKFLYAHKYERLNVLRQFYPIYDTEETTVSHELQKLIIEYDRKHSSTYGKNTVLIGNRIPVNDFILLDKRWFTQHHVPFTADSIINQLFSTAYISLGHIKPLMFMND